MWNWIKAQLAKIPVYLRSLWAHTLAWKTWLRAKEYALKVNGLQVVLASLGLFILLSVVWWDGRLSARDVRSYAVSLIEPEPKAIAIDPALPNLDAAVIAQLQAENADLQRQLVEANRGYDKVSEELHELRLKQADYSDTPRQQVSCEPVVKWKRYCPRQKTVMEELGVKF